MLSVDFFLDLAVILLSTKVLGLLTKKIQMPQVVGALVAGILLGPSVFDVVHETDFIDKMSELGVIALMFTAGLETDLHELKKCGKASLVIALAGIIFPLIGGFIVALLFTETGLLEMTSIQFLENIFIGVVLTATSVSITVETLREMGQLKTPTGTAILGAAIIDDILGIIILTIITSFADKSVSVIQIGIRISLFFVFAIICGFVFGKIFGIMSIKYGKKRRIPIYGLVFCLLLSYVAEKFFGIADITGAYLAGIIISTITQSDYILQKFEVISYMLLSPIFFASIGIKTQISSLTLTILLFTALLLIVAVGSKIIGCSLGARLSGYSKKESLRIGVGMVSRGEVALIIENRGVSMGIMKQIFFAPLVIVIVITTLITPILLKLAYRNVIEEPKQVVAFEEPELIDEVEES